MNFEKIFKTVDTLLAVRDFATGTKRDAPPEETDLAPRRSGTLAGEIETRLTNVLVAALKEAFDRDHARLDLERAHLEEQRRRAEEAAQLELRRQVADREIGRLRLLGGAALLGWILSMALLAPRIGSISIPAQVSTAAGWLLLLACIGAALTAQGRIGADVAQPDRAVSPGPAGTIAVGFLLAGFAFTAISLLL